MANFYAVQRQNNRKLRLVVDMSCFMAKTDCWIQRRCPNFYRELITSCFCTHAMIYTVYSNTNHAETSESLRQYSETDTQHPCFRARAGRSSSVCGYHCAVRLLETWQVTLFSIYRRVSVWRPVRLGRLDMTGSRRCPTNHRPASGSSWKPEFRRTRL